MTRLNALSCPDHRLDDDRDFDGQDEDDCTCGVTGCYAQAQQRACDKHGWHECTGCAVVDQSEQIELQGREFFHPACVAAMLASGDFTAEELAPWRDELLAAGVTVPEAAPVASAAE